MVIFGLLNIIIFLLGEVLLAVVSPKKMQSDGVAGQPCDFHSATGKVPRLTPEYRPLRGTAIVITICIDRTAKQETSAVK